MRTDDDIVNNVILDNIEQHHKFLHVFNDLVNGAIHHHHGPNDYDILIHDDNRCGPDDNLVVIHDNNQLTAYQWLYGPAEHPHPADLSTEEVRSGSWADRDRDVRE